MDENNNQEMQETLRQLKEGFDSLTGTLGTVAQTLTDSAKATTKRQTEADEARKAREKAADDQRLGYHKDSDEKLLASAKAYNGELIKQLASINKLNDSTIQSRVQVDLYTEQLKKQIAIQTDKVKNETILENLKKKEIQEQLKKEATDKKNIEKQKKSIDDLTKLFESPGTAFKDLTAKYKSLGDATEAYKNKLLDQHHNSILATGSIMAVSTAGTVLTSVISGLAAGFEAMLQAVWNGERGMTVAAKGNTAFVKEVNKGAQSLGDFIVQLGLANIALSLISGPVGLAKWAINGLVIGLGVATKIVGASAEKLAAYNEMAAGNRDALYKGFKELGEASMTGAEGMSGLYKSLHAANMTIKEFDKFKSIIQSAGKDVKMFGITAADGINKFAETAGQLIDSKLGRTFELMGISQDEQRESTLKYMADQARFGMLQGKSQADLLKGTGAYVQELDKLATLTGQSRREQEDARKAVMANEQLRAAMIDAERQRDAAKAAGNEREAQVQQERLNKYQETSRLAAMYQKDDPRLATGLIERIVSGVANTTEAAEAQNTVGRQIEMLEKRQGTLIQKMEAGQQGRMTAAQQYAAAGMIKGSTEGLFGGKYAATADAELIMKNVREAEAKARAEAAKQGKVFDENAFFEQLTKSTDPKTTGQVDLTRTNQKLALTLDNIGEEYVDAAGLNRLAAETFEKAVKEFGEVLLGVKKAKADKEGSKQQAPMPETKAREESQTNLTKLTTEREQIEKTKGRGSDEAKKARIAEMNARREAEKKTAIEVTASHNRAQGLASPVLVPAKPATAPKQKPGLGSAPGRQTTESTSTPHPSRQSQHHTILDKAKNILHKLIGFQGDSLGNKSHFDALDSDVKDNFNKMIAEYGKPVQVNAAHRSNEEQQQLWDEGTPTSDPNKRMRKGNPVAKPGKSKHNTGRAIDLQSSQVDELDKLGLLSKYGFNRVAGDRPHIEMANSGGVFDGPASGYQVEMHGREAVVPLPNPKSIITVDENKDGKATKQPLDSVMSPQSPISQNSSTNTDLTNMIAAYMETMEVKMDTMISKLSDSYDVQDKLLKNSMV